MKLLIQHDLKFAEAFSPELGPDEFVAEYDYFRRLEQLAAKYSITRKFELGANGVEITIFAQKVNLDEIEMNTLFSDFLTELFDVETCYAALGGAGCEFALELVTAVPTNQN